MSQDTLALDEARNGRNTCDTMSPSALWGNHPDGHLLGGGYTTGLNAVRPAVPAVTAGHTPSLYPRQEWAGRVTAIYKNQFDARLRDLTNDGRDVATIDLEEISPEDRARLHVGSRFHWVMGYERSASGTRSNVSRIVFLDPPRPTKRDLEAGRKWADRLRAKWKLG